MFARDITGRIQIEKKLNRYTRSLEQSNEQLKTLSQALKKQSEELDKRVQERTVEVQNLLQKRTELITQIGHDLKTPLTSILALLSYIGKKEQDRNLLEYIGVVIEDAKRMKHLIASTLDLLYYESGHHVNSKITSNLLSAVTRAVDSEHLQIAKKGLRIIVQVSDTISIGMPDAHLEAICSNLITNAVKYTLNNESITITAVLESEYISFVVADTGIGLSSEEIPRVFEEFYKADPSRHDGESHGLGLSIIKRIVESYSGTIRAYSEGKGKGTVFTVNFPR
jgi:signal transduction histidine kinase